MADPIATTIKNVLKGDALGSADPKYLLWSNAIYAIVGDRVLDMDYRAAGWDTAPVAVMNADDIMMPTLVVDDQGGSHPFMGPKDAEDSLVYVWSFSSRSTAGHQHCSDLFRLTKAILTSDITPVTKVSIRYVERTGVVIADDGVYDRVIYKVSGIPSPP